MDTLDANLETQKEHRLRGNNEIQLFNNHRDAVVGFLWQPRPSGNLPFANPNNATEFTAEVRQQFQNYVDGICNGPNDGKGQAQESYRTNRRDAFPVFMYVSSPEGAQLQHVATIEPTKGRTFTDGKAPTFREV